MRDFAQIQTTVFDLIVIGGGINGAGVARDAALRGLKTLLIEKNDFGSGTTSWSTRLIHGGLRYLEYFEFKLVRESLREREILLHTAPHLVKPIQMTIPLYRQGSRRYWEIQAGMLLYDLLSMDKSLLSHRMLPQQKFRQLFREINPEGLVGAAQYFDGQAEYAERLCLETVLSAQAAGATVLNYVQVTALHRKGDRLMSVTCQDRQTGDVFTVQGGDRSIFVNTSGPWVDQVLRSSDSTPIGNTPKLGGTKGSHILVNPFPGAPKTALYVEARADHRPFFIVPWLNLYLIGTTDLHYQGDLDRVKASNDEIDYLIAETNHVLPAAKLTRQDVKFTYSGIRPLPNAAGKDPGSITRNHILYDHHSEGVANLISLIGGKLTTYRRVGEEMVDAVYRKLGRSAPACPTRHLPLPGAILPHDPRIAQAIDAYRSRLSAATVHHLFRLYGAKATDLLALVDTHPDLAAPLVPSLPDIKAQVVYAVQSEMAYTLVDICHRRTTLAMQANYGFDVLPVLTATLQAYCGWSEAECDRQRAEYAIYVQENCLPDYVLEQEVAQSADVLTV
ncbi:glycerol-3-phosphate dehydrogenase [Oculatella sp. LEGE 06141]|uniref:glycerol-3-phosphate dehydrogenase n=1 Tax=Oculatella sp. LEGE 06141 TaxID=1828648 RepID=UPI0018826719|nr:glycerol-3-phosphate dehydrogenase [Oculatella sp. LEGE 06141]MBE9182748.1 glycerol-3-phosphate dehydrogenase [Oculatella sp. LEGE 06141]